MDNPVKVHIARIKEEIESLSSQQMHTTDELMLNEIETQIHSLRLALSHYELALKIESDILEKKKRSTQL